MTDLDPDARMDARLTAAGERWRDANAEKSDASIARRAVESDERPSPRHRNRLMLVASAAVVAAALVAGAVVTLSKLGDSDQDAVGGKANLIGTVWKLDGDKSGSAATLYVGKDGRLVADDECTIVGAKVDARGTQLRATDVQIRHRDCTDQYGPRLGDEFAKNLRTKPGYTAKPNTLTIGDRQFVAAPELPRPTTDVPTWEEANWKLIGARTSSGTTVPDAEGTLRVHEGRLRATDGCNGVGGEVRRTGQRVTLTAGPSAAIGCGAVGSLVESVLNGTFTAAVRETRLTVSKAGSGTLTFDWVPADPSAIDVDRLVGPTWRLSGIAGDAPVGNATLRFPSATRYVANDGCREFTGKATLEAGSAVLQGIPRSNAKSCPKAARDQASTIDSFLTEGRWTIRDGKLLIDGGGSQAYSLVYAGGASAQTADPRLLGTWQLTRLLTDIGPANNFPNSEIRLSFRGSAYRFYDTCVDRSGSYAVGGQRTTVRFDEERIADTKCTPKDPTFSDLGEGLVYGMHGVNRYRIDDQGRLVLRLRDNVTLTFVRQ